MPLALTPQQAYELNDYGFTILPSFLQGAELSELQATLGSIPPGRGRHGLETAHGDAVRKLMTHERMLPYVCDVCGYNIQCLECLTFFADPMPDEQVAQNKLHAA